MRFWLRARKFPVVLATLVVLGLVVRLGRGHVITVPTVLGGGGAAMLWSTFVPLFWGSALCAAYGSVAEPVEQRPLRHVVRLDCGLFLLGTAAFAAVFVCADGRSAWIAVLAHALILGGLGTAVTILWGAGIGAMAVTSTVLITCTYSPRLAGARHARFLQPDGDVGFALLLGLALSVFALSAVWRRR
ncbi:hypothetical protein [Marmoricola sp. RAF53]|uniref:hypothetical protein n=1 Tax=Marmoricola sp. RAF53 TaxID=3233059 RepID=UPI003F9B3D80